MEGSILGELWRPEGPQGAIGQYSNLQGVDEAPDSWEQHLSTCSLSLENLEGLTAKVDTLGLRAARKNCYGAAKKRARRARVAGSLDGDSCCSSVSAGSEWPTADPAGAQYIWDPGCRKCAGEIWTWSKILSGPK